MTQTALPRWQAMRTPETEQVEEALRKGGFEKVDAYRYNKASIRLRVIDQRFEKLSLEQRDALVEPHLDQLPEGTQADIMSLFTFAPSEIQQGAKPTRELLMNIEFEDPSPSIL